MTYLKIQFANQVRFRKLPSQGAPEKNQQDVLVNRSQQDTYDIQSNIIQLTTTENKITT